MEEKNLLDEFKDIVNLKNILSNLDTIDEDDPDFTGLESAFVVMNLDDEEFYLMSQLLLDETAKSFNDPDQKLAMINALKWQDLKVEDVEEAFQNLINDIDETLSESYPQYKRDFLKRFLSIMVEAIASIEGVPKRLVPVTFAFCREDAKQPSYAHVGDSGMDVYSTEDYEIQPGEVLLIPTGIKVIIPNGYELQVRPRSGLSLKTKLRIANAPGTIDASFREEICIIMENTDSKVRDIEVKERFDEKGNILGYDLLGIDYGQVEYIEKGQRIAQLVLMEVPKAAFYEIEEILNDDSERKGGFGSTGE